MDEITTQNKQENSKPQSEAPKGPAKGTYTLEIEGKTCNLKPLNRSTFKIVLGMVAPGNKDPRYIEAGQIILNTCWIDGDVALKDDTSEENSELNCSACLKACELIDIKEGTLKKN